VDVDVGGLVFTGVGDGRGGAATGLSRRGSLEMPGLLEIAG